MQPAALWKSWKGKTAGGKFPLQKWIGGSDHSAVFLTEYKSASGQGNSQKAAIKIIPADDNAKVQLSRWEQAFKFSVPHLIRLFEHGQCEIDGTPVLYVVMEFAEENLAEIIPLRALTDGEAQEMLRPAAEALTALHKSGFVHGGLKPSNVMAVDNQLKLSSDGVSKAGESSSVESAGVYGAPELANSGATPAADMWSLGLTLLAVLTQREPKNKPAATDQIRVPATITQPLRGIVERCLETDPAKRCTAADVLRQLSGGAAVQAEIARPVQIERHQAAPSQAAVSQAAVSYAAASQAAASRAVKREPGRSGSGKKWLLISAVIVALLAAIWIGRAVVNHSGAGSQNQPTASPANAAAGSTTAPLSATLPQPGVVRGSVLQRIMPDVSPNALHTVRGRLKVAVQVSVDAAGAVTDTKLVSPGPSRYFAGHALAAARQWKFTAARVNGQPAASQWMLRFQFARSGSEVSPSETKP